MKKVNNKSNSSDFYFKKVVDSITREINERAKAMIADRFGFYGNEIKTLGQIGDEYGITRERVRQIIQEAINKSKQKAKEDSLFRKAEEKIKFTIEKNYGIIARKDLIKSLAKGNHEESFIDFVLHCSESFDVLEDKHEIEEAIVKADFEIEKWKRAKENAKKILEGKGKALSSGIFFKKFSEVHPEINEDEFFNYVEVSREIKKGVFGKWGIATWGEINPKGIRQKAHLVIKESKEPLHFRDVAKLIDDHKLNKKKTHPQTVHNELIKDENFVLVGRGTYALKEWGYQRGTVKDVIEEILKDSQAPVHQDEIVEKVLSVRNVKEATVIINLNNFFEKMDSRKYSLKDSQIKERA